jgi:hypothetical protein
MGTFKENPGSWQANYSEKDMTRRKLRGFEYCAWEANILPPRELAKERTLEDSFDSLVTPPRYFSFPLFFLYL